MLLMDLRSLIRCWNSSRWELLTATLNPLLVQWTFIYNHKTTDCHQPAHMFPDWPCRGRSDSCVSNKHGLGRVVLSGIDERSHLKLLSRHKGEVTRPLLSSPLVADAAVADDHLLVVFVKARVEVEGDVTAFANIQCDPKKVGRTLPLQTVHTI